MGSHITRKHGKAAEDVQPIPFSLALSEATSTPAKRLLAGKPLSCIRGMVDPESGKCISDVVFPEEYVPISKLGEYED